MAAQGYQESQLDQNARSPVGAIGVMQFMPETGKEMDVGDITQAEPNINAGIKYMRYMIDQFFENEPMSKLDKALFAFASYNAGPGPGLVVAQGSRETRPRPEHLVSQRGIRRRRKDRAGDRHLRGNIYKYYVAYRLILDSQQARKEAAEKVKGEKQ